MEVAKQVFIMSNNIASFQLQLKSLKSRFLNYSPAQQSIIHAKISELSSGNLSALAKPSVVKAKGRPLGALFSFPLLERSLLSGILRFVQLYIAKTVGGWKQ